MAVMLKVLLSGPRHSPHNYRYVHLTENSAKAWTYVDRVDKCIDDNGRVLSNWNPTDIRTGYTRSAPRHHAVERVTNRINITWRIDEIQAQPQIGH